MQSDCFQIVLISQACEMKPGTEYRSGFRHDTATRQAAPQHAAPFVVALDTGTCKAVTCSAVRGDHVQKLSTNLKSYLASSQLFPCLFQVGLGTNDFSLYLQVIRGRSDHVPARQVSKSSRTEHRWFMVWLHAVCPKRDTLNSQGPVPGK